MTESIISMKVLFLGQKPIVEGISRRITESFDNFGSLSDYVCKTLVSTDKYLLLIPSDQLENLLHDPIYEFPQVQTVFVYQNGAQTFQRNENPYRKIRFYSRSDLFRMLDKSFIDIAINLSSPVDRQAIDEFASSVSERVSTKRPSNYPSRDQIELHYDGRLVWTIDSIREKIGQDRNSIS